MVYCFGEVLWDVFPTGSLPGGAPMNVNLHINKLGLNTCLISAVGKDEEGDTLLRYLNSNHVNTDYIQRNDLPTGKVMVNLDDPLNAVYDIVFPVAYDAIRLEHLSDLPITNDDFLVYGSLASRDEATLHTLLKFVQRPFTKIFDVNLRKPHYQKEVIITLLKTADWVKLNEEEFSIICSWYTLSPEDKETFKILCGKWDASLICITKGQEGASLFYQGKLIHHSGYSVKVVDTVGAGDAFLAALIAGFIIQMNPEEMLDQACALGALVAGRAGANPDYELKDLERSKT